MSNQTFKNGGENQKKIKMTPVKESSDSVKFITLADKNALRSNMAGDEGWPQAAATRTNPPRGLEHFLSQIK